MNETYRINDIDRNLKIARFNPLDVLVIGGTGAGKSSTLNAMFEREISKVGRGCDPETMEISSYKLNEKLRFWDTPGLGDSKEGDRILVAINQADMAMKGRHWDEEKNRPDEKLLSFLKDKTESVVSRVKEGTGVSIKRPVFYSAERAYNIESLLDLIVDNMPRERRNLVA